MGLKSFFMRIMRRPASIDSINQSQINQSIINKEENLVFEQQTETPEFTQIPLHKDSFELGLATGYTGKSIKDVESSLNRIESQIVTKDWFSNTFEDKTPELVEAIKKHEENDQKRFEMLVNLLKSPQTAPGETPETLRTNIFVARSIESQLQLTPKMQELVNIVKGVGEISYKDLAQKLLISEDALRGLLSNTIRRSRLIERFEQKNRGWVKYRY
jgi:DNA-directed RNA polymerase specialized sigma24 family protein